MLFQGIIAISALITTTDAYAINELQRNTRDSIGQNRISNNIYAYKRARNNNKLESDLLWSMQKRFGGLNLSLRQQNAFDRLMRTARSTRSAKNNKFDPIIDIRRF